MTMITSTEEGDRLKDQYIDQIEKSINGIIKYRKEAHDEDLATIDFCVFVRESGYIVMFKDAYKKLTKKEKKLIERSYKYRRIEE